MPRVRHRTAPPAPQKIGALEAVKQFQQASVWGGVIYIILAIAGVLFSVFITLWNRRNKKLLKEQKKK